MVYMIITEVVFIEGRLLSSQSEQFQKALIGWKKPALQKGQFRFGHENKPYMFYKLQIKRADF